MSFRRCLYCLCMLRLGFLLRPRQLRGLSGVQGMFTSCSPGASPTWCAEDCWRGARALGLGTWYRRASACSDCASAIVVYAIYRWGARADCCANANRGCGVCDPGSETRGVYAGRGHHCGLASVSRAWSRGPRPVVPGFQRCVLQAHLFHSCGCPLARSAATLRSGACLPRCTQLTYVHGAGRSVSPVHQRTVHMLRTIRSSSTLSLLACRTHLGVWSLRLRHAVYGSRVCPRYLRLVPAGTS
jgi:hypothetical protein